MIESRTGNMGRGLLELVAYINGVKATKSLNIIEVGSYKGDSAAIFQAHFRMVYCVDAWEQALFNVPGSAAEAEAIFDERLAGWPNVVKCKGRSLQVSGFIKEPADVVYIDASHDYGSVKADIVAWKPHARLFLCGHDYWPRRFPGVVRAVGETVGKPARVFADTSWAVAL